MGCNTNTRLKNHDPDHSKINYFGHLGNKRRNPD